jgi:hypothetical protein
MCTISREEAAWRQGARGRKRAGGAEKRKKLRVVVWHGKQEMPVARSHDPEREIEVVLPLQSLELWLPCKVRWVWVGAVAKYLFWPRAHCSSPRPAAPRRCRSRKRAARQMYSGAGRLYPSRRGTFGTRTNTNSNGTEVSSSRWPIASRRALHRRRMFNP